MQEVLSLLIGRIGIPYIQGMYHLTISISHGTMVPFLQASAYPKVRCSSRIANSDMQQVMTYIAECTGGCANFKGDTGNVWVSE